MPPNIMCPARDWLKQTAKSARRRILRRSLGASLPQTVASVPGWQCREAARQQILSDVHICHILKFLKFSEYQIVKYSHVFRFSNAHIPSLSNVLRFSRILKCCHMLQMDYTWSTCEFGQTWIGFQIDLVWLEPMDHNLQKIIQTGKNAINTKSYETTYCLWSPRGYILWLNGTSGQTRTTSNYASGLMCLPVVPLAIVPLTIVPVRPAVCWCTSTWCSYIYIPICI